MTQDEIDRVGDRIVADLLNRTDFAAYVAGFEPDDRSKIEDYIASLRESLMDEGSIVRLVNVGIGSLKWWKEANGEVPAPWDWHNAPEQPSEVGRDAGAVSPDRPDDGLHHLCREVSLQRRLLEDIAQTLQRMNLRAGA